jgi:hypothetical protein
MTRASRSILEYHKKQNPSRSKPTRVQQERWQTAKVARFPEQRFADAPLFLRMLGENAGHRPRLHKLFLKGLAVAAGQRWVMMQIAEAQKFAREWKPTPQPTPTAR